MSAYTEKEREQHEIDMMFFMLTNILTESTDLICTGQGAEQLIANAFHVKDEDMENVSGQDRNRKASGRCFQKETACAADHDGITVANFLQQPGCLTRLDREKS